MLTTAATAGDLVDAALREIGVLGGGETAPAHDSEDALSTLNRAIDHWGIQNLMLYEVLRTTWTIASGTGQYLVGTGATVDVARPASVESVVVKYQDTSLSDTTEFALTKLTEEGWRNIDIKTQTAVYPSMFYYTPSYVADADGHIELWPIPTSSTLQGVLYAPYQVPEFSGLTTLMYLPNGYARMIVKNLALELCPSYGRQADPLLVSQARDAIAWVKQNNHRLTDLAMDPSALIGMENGANYSIYQG